MAQGVIFYLLKRGLSVPDDVTVIGIGDFKGSKEMEPALNTIHFPTNKIGGLARPEMC
ncbi:substrate-binding domain-containing protein [Planktomarina sp.]|nr:substrate-binding domain-containing protein [Planktomarina sp.]MDA9100133.1 substrate-binding domain-containing protein [Planktomarina sp.]